MRLLPVAMVVATVGMMVLYFKSGAGVARNPAYLFFPVMMLASALGSLAEQLEFNPEDHYYCEKLQVRKGVH